MDEFARPAHEVSMDVRLEDVRDRDAEPLRELQIDLDIWPRIDHGRDPSPVVAYEVRELCDSVGLDTLEDQRHGGDSPGRRD